MKARIVPPDTDVPSGLVAPRFEFGESFTLGETPFRRRETEHNVFEGFSVTRSKQVEKIGTLRGGRGTRTRHPARFLDNPRER